MRTFEDLKAKTVQQILSAPNSEVALKAYGLVWSFIPEYKFVFGGTSGSMPGFAINQQLPGDAVVRSLFKENYVFVLDPDSLKEMLTGKAKFRIDYSISLDTMAFSHLAKYITTQGEIAPEGFVEVFEFLARDDVKADGLPYILENFTGADLQNEKRSKDVFETIKAFEVLRNINLDHLMKTGLVRSTLDDTSLMKRAQESVASLFFDPSRQKLINALNVRVNYWYTNLLKIALIQFERKGRSADDKVEEYLEFCHSSLATMNGREMVLAREFFERGTDFKFFGKVQVGRSKLLASLKNMAWDLVHVHQLESGMSLRPDPTSRYFFPALLTYDKGLIEVMDLYALRAIAFTRDEKNLLPAYAGDYRKAFSSDGLRAESIEQRFCSDGPAEDRRRRRDGVLLTLPRLIRELETALGAFIQRA